MKHLTMSILANVFLVSAVIAAPKKNNPGLEHASAKGNLEAIEENGVLINARVFAPLHEHSIAESTIVIWKEDLLDEAAKAPAASQPVYKQAANLLEAWKSALLERSKLRADSKFTGHVSDSTDMESSRKTNLHLCDWVAYERERDAAHEHHRKDVQTAKVFAQGPPKIWADRSALLRPLLDRQYAQLRELRREMLQQARAPQPAVPVPKPQTAAVPASTVKEGAAVSGADPIVGSWQWDDKSIVHIRSDGKFKGEKGRHGTWQVVPENKNYRLKWDSGSSVELTLSSDNRSLSGESQKGHKLHAERLETAPPSEPIVKSK